MLAEIVAVGDELTSGQRLDTNSQWLSQQLGDLGIIVRFHTTVADDLDAMVQVYRTAASRVSLMVITGGLGPTADDLTRQALAQAAGRELRLDAEVLAGIRAKFARFGRTMPPQNEVQAMFPEGSRVIPNPHGTAPGIDLTVDGRCRVIALPGVPAEMKEMWQQTVQAALSTGDSRSQMIRHHRIKCFGVGESQLEGMLPDLIRRGRDPQVGITVHRATITLRISARAADEASCWQRMQPTVATIRECLGQLVYGEEDDELHHVVLRQLEERQQTLAVCEWGTDGLVAHWLSDSDQSGRLQTSMVISSVDALTALLGPPPPRDEGPAAFVSWMADQWRRKIQADYALAIGPRPADHLEKPRIHFSLAGPQQTTCISRRFAGHPDVVLERAAKQALDHVRLELANGPS